VLALAILLSASFPSAQAQAMAPPPAQQRPTLYQQLGGYDGVHEFVALVFPRVAQHPQLRHMFQGHGADSQQRQFQLVVEMVCQRTGGPCAYIGRDMTAVHVGLGITAANWETFMAIIDRGLDEKKYSPPVRAAFREMWASFRDSVVEP
jgi:hemoglobin